ncbi:MAG: methylated-DNA--[Clostridia bacterium]|nr:methylated-DNA--[protein]-cysteine S-methyltransferase [Clostridia bacterium]
MKHTAYYPWKFGLMSVIYEDEILLGFDRAYCVDGEDIKSGFSDRVCGQIREYLDGKRRTFDLPYALHGTPFQMSVWRALCDIPYGETRSYADIARAVGNPKACRAVGMSNHRNPISIIVPCHRVIAADGSIGGYGGGLDMKEALLTLEGVKIK